MKKLALSTLALALAGFSSASMANQPVDISMTITPGCQIDPIAPVSLGSVQYIENVITSGGTFNIRCQVGQTFAWTFDNGDGDVNYDSLSGRRFLRKEVAPGIYEDGPKIAFQVLSDGGTRVLTAPNTGNNLSSSVTGNGTFTAQLFDVRVRPQDQTAWWASPGTYKARLNLVVVF